MIMLESLPYWNVNLDMDVVSWLPLGIDYRPISVNYMYSGELVTLANLSLALQSELFYVSSPRLGFAGPFLRDRMIIPGRGKGLSFGFTAVFGYSELMEDLVARETEKSRGIRAGMSLCNFWNRAMLLGSFKSIVLTSVTPFFDDEDFLSHFMKAMMEVKGDPNLGFFAEQFGYRRFSIPYETDDPLKLEISRLLYEMEFDETREAGGPSPEVAFPLPLNYIVRLAQGK